MNNGENNNPGRLTVVMITGLILVAVPVSCVLIMLIYSFFRDIEKRIQPAIGLTSDIIISSGLPTDTFFIIVAVLVLCGILLLSWVAFRKNRQERE